MQRQTQNRIFAWFVGLAILAGIWSLLEYKSGGTADSAGFTRAFVTFFAFALGAFVMALLPARRESPPAPAYPLPVRTYDGVVTAVPAAEAARGTPLGTAVLEARQKKPTYRTSTAAPSTLVPNPPTDFSLQNVPEAPAEKANEASPTNASATASTQDPQYWHQMYEAERRRLQRLYSMYQEVERQSLQARPAVEAAASREVMKSLLELENLKMPTISAGTILPPLTLEPAVAPSDPPAPTTAETPEKKATPDPAPESPAPPPAGKNGTTNGAAHLDAPTEPVVASEPLADASGGADPIVPANKSFAARTVEYSLRKDLV